MTPQVDALANLPKPCVAGSNPAGGTEVDVFEPSAQRTGAEARRTDPQRHVVPWGLVGAGRWPSEDVERLGVLAVQARSPSSTASRSPGSSRC